MSGDLNIDTAFFLKYLFNPPAIIWKGLWLTIWISVVAQALGVAIGLLIALCIRSKRASLRGSSRSKRYLTAISRRMSWSTVRRTAPMPPRSISWSRR